jgi:hypothetical protein
MAEEDLDYAYIRRRLSHEPDIPEGANIEVVGYTPILWSGWEGDFMGVLYRIAPEEQVRLYVMDGVHVAPEQLLATLKERLVEYERVIGETKIFLAKAHLAFGDVFDGD